MAKKSGPKDSEESAKKAGDERPVTEPWLSKRTGLIVMALISLGLAVMVGWQVYPALGLGEALLWAAGFGVSVWVVFVAFYFFNTWIRGRSGSRR